MDSKKLWNNLTKQKHAFFLIAGPCVIESERICISICQKLVDLTSKLDIPYIFKASFDKANRTSIRAFRGLGLKKGLEILSKIKNTCNIPVLTDVHESNQCKAIADIVDIIQIPALLSRQTDLITAAANTNKIINIKKGQFMAPWDIRFAIEKAKEQGNNKIMVTERGTSFGYNNIVVDFRSLAIMKEYGAPIIFDASHSIQLPSAKNGCSDGNIEYIAPLARAAIAFGVNGLFLEVHETPERALSDGPNSFRLAELPALLKELKSIQRVITNDIRNC